MIDEELQKTLDGINLGPRGGDLNNPNGSQYRRQSLNATRDATGQPGLHSAPEKNWIDTSVPGLQREQPWHRMAAFMLLMGRTNSEIAAAADVHPQSVSNLRAQRWFQELLGTLANESGQDIQGLVASEAAASIAKIVDIRDNPDVSARVQLSAAQMLLEHAHGKPTQKVVTARASSASSADLHTQMEELTAEIQALEKQVQHQQ